MKSFLFVIFLLSSLVTSAAEVTLCQNLFGLSDLQKSIRSLAELRLNIDLAKANNNSSLGIGALTSQYDKKENEFYLFLLENNIMSREELRKKIKAQVAEIQNDKSKNLDREREKRLQDDHISELDGTLAVFHNIEPDSFITGPLQSRHTAVIKESFQMMSTHVTQEVWKNIVELANARGYNIEINPSDKDSRGYNLPVVAMTSLELTQFLKALNEMSDAGVRDLEKILASHRKGDKYRLPSKIEFDYIARGGGAFKGEMPFDSLEVTEQYAWFGGNEEAPLQPVARKKPFVVQGKDFYDVIGNAYHYVSDRYIDPNNLDLDLRTFMGAGARTNRFIVNYSAYEGSVRADMTLRSLGFRLVREVKK